MNIRLSQILLSASIITGTTTYAAPSDIGADLYQKQSIAREEVPAQALAAIEQLHPGFTLKEAEQESKHGHQYLDLEGIAADGSEIEFDMLLNEDNLWEVVEIQRDVSLADCPEAVRQVYQAHYQDLLPQRIIESRQMDGMIIYEFYFVEQGKTRKQEIKLDAGHASLLEQEWKH